jgi:hypothetical protein
MKQIIIILILTITILSCGQNKSSNQQDNLSETEKSEFNEEEYSDNITESEYVGDELFQSILDTVTIKQLTSDLLINSNWTFTPFEDCKSTYKFKLDGNGESYNCEMDETTEIKYKIENDYLLIEEFDIPHVDNEDKRKIKTRDDKYIFNGQSLIMVGSIMHTGGKSKTPEIEIVIRYDKN